MQKKIEQIKKKENEEIANTEIQEMMRLLLVWNCAVQIIFPQSATTKIKKENEMKQNT